MQLTATECVECRCTTAPAFGRSRIHRGVQEGFLGRLRRRRSACPCASSRDSRAGSSVPSDEPVGVISQPPSASATEMLPVEPCVSPRSNSEAPVRQISLAQLRVARSRQLAPRPSGRSRARRSCRTSAPAPAARRLARARVHGTPGSISGPISSAVTPSAADDRARGFAAGDDQPREAGGTRALLAAVGQRRLDHRARRPRDRAPPGRRATAAGSALE